MADLDIHAKLYSSFMQSWLTVVKHSKYTFSISANTRNAHLTSQPTRQMRIWEVRWQLANFAYDLTTQHHNMLVDY